jgi:ligand-binding SRPBCC domain-containing protein
MPAGDHILTCQLFLPRPRKEVFAFFAAAENLEQITPPEVRFRMVSPVPIQITEGTRISYRLRLFGIPFRWQSLISRWDPNECCVDEQIKGPYAR